MFSFPIAFSAFSAFWCEGIGVRVRRVQRVQRGRFLCLFIAFFVGSVVEFAEQWGFDPVFEGAF